MQAQQRRVPPHIQHPDGHTVYLIDDAEMDELLPPPTELPIPCSGFMDHEGHIHYELCHFSWYPPRGFWNKLKISFNMKDYYLSTPRHLCEGGLHRDPNELVGAGVATYYPQDHHAELVHLGLRPRSEIPEFDVSLRKDAIFRFQRSYNRFIQWLGGTRLTTYTAIIPDDKMQALGWKPFKFSSMRERLKYFWYCLPPSLFGKLRAYEINLPVDETG